jgi:hypothetical protein
MTNWYDFKLEYNSHYSLILATETSDYDIYIMRISNRGCLRRIPDITYDDFACAIKLTNNGKLREINQPPIVPRRHNSRSR